MHSELRRTGFFECSDRLLNQLHRNVVWGLEGNFLDLPTDCPQRNERLGWTGDIAAFAPSAAYLFDVEAFLADWLVDLDLEQQHAEGMVPFVVPDVLKHLPAPEEFPDPDSTAIWSDAAVWVPWTLYQAYGDKAVLERQYASMAAHVRRVETLLSPTGLWDTSFQFGDWLDPDASPHEPWNAKADSGRRRHRLPPPVRLDRRGGGGTPRPHRRRRGLPGARGADARRRSTSTTSPTTARIRSDCTTVYTLAIVFGLLDDDDDARRLVNDSHSWSPRAATGSPLASPAPRSSPRRSQDRSPRRRLPAPAPA